MAEATLDYIELPGPSMESAGGAITSRPHQYPGGVRLHFRDPSGNMLGVCQSA